MTGKIKVLDEDGKLGLMVAPSHIGIDAYYQLTDIII